ncbi:hypothetical protein [Streptomyces poriferorum]|uniref:Uncharacterized protein n=1 Tax=Streptomyces poriferorum TaxID=2798799 RepID=A0ABY9IYR4_9ACTN|nr:MULTISPECIES: hypothetical protein [unclassified Streptomyces]MDP5310396.1 hypothetical protein [Streptomyces sp. Alt4]WLQ60450.1 hypothetical protein P8A19_35725 [Streptomyces sp. Alt2]
MDPFVPKGEPRPLSGQTCGYKPRTATADCGKPAAWHVMWDAQLDNSLTCDEHMNLIQQRWMYADRHPITADCTMPGALWVFVNDKCEVPTSTDSAARRAEMPVEVS